jgi:hypothetical protein
MTQTATYPNLEALPNVATQAFLYFSSSMGTLTEVDVVTSGSFSSQFSAENLGPSSTTITGTTSAKLSINLPSGAIPVTIPAVPESVNASPFDGHLDDAGSSGKEFAPVTSSSTAQTTVLTSPADLAAFTGSFRIPNSVSGHATGSATSGNNDLSAGFKTQTSATITVIYHYIPNLPPLDPPPGQSPGLRPTGTTGPGTVRRAGMSSAGMHHVAAHGKKSVPTHLATSAHKVVHQSLGRHPRPTSVGHSHTAKTRLITAH